MNLSDTGIKDVRWWEDDNATKRALIVCDVAARIWRDQAPAREGMLRAARMYGSLPMMGLSPKLYRQRTMMRGRRLALNLIKAVINTYTAMVTKDVPKISFVTSGGDDALQRRAKRLEKFVDGTFYDQRFQTSCAYQLVRDSALFDFGVVKFFCDESDPDHPRVGLERNLPWEWLYDDQESADGSPPNGYHVKFGDRRAFAADVRRGKYGKPNPRLAAAIEMSGTSGFDDMAEAFDAVNLVEWCTIIEAWHLPPDKNTPGRHVIAVVGVDECVVDEEYTWNRFPCELLYRERPIQGVHGESLADELAPIQIEISRLLLQIQRAQMYAVGHWLVEENSRVNTNAIDDVTASIIRYAGTRPEYEAVSPVAPDVYAHLDRLWNRGFEVVGVSQMNSAGQKPAGLNSGKAMLVYADVTSNRFKPCYAEYQDFFMRVAQQILHWAANIAERHPNFSVKAPGKMMADVRWADANLREEEYVMDMFPTNKLADEPAARLSQVQDMMNAGMITPEDGRRLLDMPDIEAINSYESASYDNTMEAARRIIEEGKYFGPVGQMDLADAVKRMQQVFLKARFDGVKPDRLDMLDRWIQEAKEQLDELQPPPPPPQPGPPGPPGPGAPPPPGGPAPMQTAIQANLRRIQAHRAAEAMVGA